MAEGPVPLTPRQKVQKDVDELIFCAPSKSNKSLAGGTKVFIQPKRNKCKKRIHIAKDNETLYEISQYYGIKMKKLQKRNLFFVENQLKSGDKIRLR